MKLKKLITIACWAIIVAMGITLTGCNLNVKDILGEISSVVKEESSTDTNTASSDGGTWVQTETRYFAYKNGEEQYVSKQNEGYKYRCYYRGVTEDNFVKFQVSGGFYHPTN